MNKAFEKILERLEVKKSIIPINRLLDDIIKDKPKELGQLMAYNNAIKIVQEVAEEYKDGWISCSEMLPKENVDVLVWFEYFRYGRYNRLFQTIGISYVYNGEWSGFVNGSSGWRDLRIIAWQPLPEPYQPKGE